MSVPQRAWTDADVAKARELWASGMSLREMAEAIGGCSKDAVQHLVRRQGWPPRPSPIGQPKPKARKRRASRAIPRPPQPARAPLTPPVPLRTCAWLLGERPAWRPCGAAVSPGRPYCASHAQVAYVHGSRVAAA
jgi:GcrA cell cycle regulator